MKTAEELYMGWNEFNEPAESMIRRVQVDALEAAIVACEEVMKANLDVQEEPLDRDDLCAAEGAYDGAADCIVLIRRLKDGPPAVPSGNNPMQEAK